MPSDPSSGGSLVCVATDHRFSDARRQVLLMLDISEPALAVRINAYGSNLRQAILRQHPTLTSFADVVGATRNDIYAWCGGQRLPSMPAHAKIIQILHYDPLTDRTWDPPAGG